MKIKSKSIHPDLHFRVLYTIEKDPNVSQRQLANNLGISLGGVNYCLKALIELGQIKVKNFNRSPSKSSYIYLLTPKGFSTKASLASEFLKRKMAEYQKLKEEIDSIQLKVGK